MANTRSTGSFPANLDGGCAKNQTLVRFLQKNHRMETVSQSCSPNVKDKRFTVFLAIGDRSQLLKADDDPGVLELPAGVFTPSNRRLGMILRDRQNQFQANRANRRLDSQDKLAIRMFHGNKIDWDLRATRCFVYRSDGTIPVAADEFGPSVNYHLRRIRPCESERLGVGILPITECRLRKRVLPSEIVPIVDMLTKNDYLGADYRLGRRQTR